MGVAKVDYFGSTLVDLTGVTVDSAHLVMPYTAFGADGEHITGSIFDWGVTSLPVVSSASSPASIPAGVYRSGSTVGIVPTEADKIISSNIKDGVTILGVQGGLKVNVTNMSLLHLNVGGSDNNSEIRQITFTVSGKVNSLYLMLWGYQSSVRYNARRVIALTHVPNFVSLGNRYRFLCANGGASTSSGYNQANGYISNFDGVTYTYNSTSDQTTVVITAPNSNMSGYSGTPRFSGDYHVITFYAENDRSNIHDSVVGSVSTASPSSTGGGNLELMSGGNVSDLMSGGDEGGEEMM